VNNPDTASPTVSITSPISGTTYTSAQTITIQASAADNVGVSKVEFYDGATLAGTATASPYKYNWSFSSLNNGTHVWTAKAYDVAGNTGTSSQVTLTVNVAPDTVPPVVSISGPLTVSGKNKTFTALASDNVGILKVEFYLDNAGLPFIIDTSVPYTAAVPLTGRNALSSGNHTIKAKAYDTSNNTALAQMNFTK
ncbi:MAG: Ig-like domain-containing protein, partial [Patescibacteria group bacterium]